MKPKRNQIIDDTDSSSSSSQELSQSSEASVKSLKSQDGVYKVEKILKVSTGRKGKKHYLIKWLGYSDADNSWEPKENITEVCPELIDEFEAEVREKLKKG